MSKSQKMCEKSQKMQKKVKYMENMENGKKDRKYKISTNLSQIWKQKSKKEILSFKLKITDKKRKIQCKFK